MSELDPEAPLDLSPFDVSAVGVTGPLPVETGLRLVNLDAPGLSAV